MTRLPNRLPRMILLIGVMGALLGCATQKQHTFTYSQPLLPEVASGYADKPGWSSKKFAVAAANPLATDAGYQILKAGGSAVDASIAVQMVLGLVEPQSSGIGGGAFMLLKKGDHAEDDEEAAEETVKLKKKDKKNTCNKILFKTMKTSSV